MNTLRIVNNIFRLPNRYAGTFSRVMVSIHPDELCSLKDSIEILEQGLLQASEIDGNNLKIIKRMKLIHGDSKIILQSLSPEIIYIDPMHPIRKKSALVKKEMRLLRDLVGDDPDSGDLIELALKRATKRVVLKWPLSADSISGLVSPTHQIIGKTTRYDVFMINKWQNT